MVPKKYTLHGKAVLVPKIKKARRNNEGQEKSTFIFIFISNHIWLSGKHLSLR
jgi:hypothetical protein